MIAVQFALLLVAWTHACIGLYFWLRLKPFFKWAGPILLAIAILLPPLAMIGAHHGAREVVELAKQPQWRAKNLTPMPPPQRAVIDDITLFYFPIAYLAAIGLVFAARGVRTLHERRRGMFTVSYPNRQVRVPKGMSVLEASLRFKIPHASVCGGRARCSTCRVRVVSDRSTLPRPSGREAFVLARVGASADPSIRLACQLRPQTDVAVIPVLPPNVGTGFVRSRQRLHIGEERYVVSMFVDMRGSTTLAEARLPFDVVFLINRFVEAASQAVIAAGGQPNQFVGDGVLALFGLDVDPPTACRQALRAASLVASNVAYLNHQFTTEVREPIQFGIGIHGGEVIVGDIGFRGHTVFTALGELGQCRGAAAGPDQESGLQGHPVGRRLQDRGHRSRCAHAHGGRDLRSHRDDDRAHRGGPDRARQPARSPIGPRRAAVVRSRSPGVIGPAGSVWE